MTRSALTLVLACASAACAPSVEGLVRDHHYAEAFAAVETEHPELHERVCRAVLADAATALHIAIVPHAQVAHALGPDADLLAEARVARLHATFGTPRDVSTLVTAELRDGRTPVPHLDTSESALAELTGEAAEARGRASAEATSRENAKTVWLLTNIFLAGIPELTRRAVRVANPSLAPAPEPSDVGRPDVSPPKAAPRARRLAQLFAGSAAGTEDGGDGHGHVDRFVVWRVRDEASPRLAVAITVHLTAGSSAGCTEEVVAPLPPGETMEERLAALFGGRERAVTELGPGVVIVPRKRRP